MRIRLADDRRKKLLERLKTYYLEKHDEPIGDLRAGMLLDFFVKELGPPVYNQAIRDAQVFLQQRIEDLEITYMEPEDTRSASGREEE